MSLSRNALSLVYLAVPCTKSCRGRTSAGCYPEGLTMTNDDNDGGWSEVPHSHKVHRRIVLNLDEAWAIWWALYTFANNRPRDGWSRTRAEKILAKIEALKDALERDREKAVRRERRKSKGP